MASRYPDVIGIGTRRCGTSWLHAVLNSHPEIGKPASGLHYFSDQYHLGRDWYAEQLTPFSNRRLLMEFSVSYLYPEHCDATAIRMKREVPEAKLFLCVRNPVARAYSDYLRSVRMNEIAASIPFEKAVTKLPVLLDRGRYARLLSPYLDNFPQDRIKVLFYEDLEFDPVGFATELADFLGVSPTFSSEMVNRAEPKGKTVRSQWLNRAIHGMKGAADSMAERLGQTDHWSNWKGRYMGLYEKTLDLTHRKQDMNKALAASLAREFSDDVAFLERFTGKDLRGWYEA